MAGGGPGPNVPAVRIARDFDVALDAAHVTGGKRGEVGTADERSGGSKGGHWQTFTLRGVVDISPQAPAVFSMPAVAQAMTQASARGPAHSRSAAG